jgi:hypothetical protein
MYKLLVTVVIDHGVHQVVVEFSTMREAMLAKELLNNNKLGIFTKRVAEILNPDPSLVNK